MFKLKNINTNKLRNDELLGVLQETLEFSVALLSNERDASVLTMFRSAVEEYRDALMQNFYTKETKAKDEADKIACEQYRGLKHLVKSMLLHPDKSVRLLAQDVMHIIYKHGKIIHSSMAHRYAKLDEMMCEINALGSDVHSALGIETWLEGLTLAIAKYKVARDVQRKERVEYQKGWISESRARSEVALRELTETVNAHRISFGEEDYKDWVKNLNAVAELQKSIIKSRASRTEEAEEAEKPTTEDEQSPSEEQKEPSQEKVEESTTVE